MATRKIIPIKQITAWSFSRYTTYKQCPALAKYKFIDKLKEPGSAAMDRGSAIHKLAENFIKGILVKFPPELKLFEVEFKALKKQFKKKGNGMVVEENWSFTKDWAETEWDNWVHCWVRIKLDCAHHIKDDTLVVVDFKTGKFRPEMNDVYLEQLELYALAALLLHPHLIEVRPQLMYLDQGIIYPGEDNPLIFTPKDIPRLKTLWAKRVSAMLNDTTFAPKANDKCKWCFFSASKNGPCKY